MRRFLAVCCLLVSACACAQSAADATSGDQHDATQPPFNAALPRLRIAPQLVAPKPGDQPGATFFRAREIRGDGQSDVMEAFGDVVARNRSEVIRADWARYSQSTDTIDARGNVRWRSLYDAVTTDTLSYSPGTQRGVAGETQFELGRFGGRGAAKQLRFEGEEKYGLDHADYTTCKTPTPAWCLVVEKLDIDGNRDVGVAKGAKLYFFDIPVFYLPSLSFPLGKERKSGFLAPTYGSTGNRGFELMVPYYLNLAPNYDATLTPRLMTKRGLQLQGEFRYLFDGMKGIFVGEVLPRDRVADLTRTRLYWKHEQSLWAGVNLGVDVQRVSDDTYFVDLADRVTATSLTTVPRFVTLSSTWYDWEVAARLQRFQTLQDPTAASPFIPPYEKVPEISAHRVWRDVRGFDASIDMSVARFQHAYLTEGVRSVALGTVSYPWRAPGAFVIPKMSLHASDYRLDGRDLDYTDTTRVVPISSLDMGLLFERDATLFGKGFTQTLEPRLFYTYIPYKNQQRIPNFDSAPIDFNFAQLFQENRYSGQDRIGDANQLTAAVTTRFLEDGTGRERVRVSIGERFYFNDQRVGLGETVRESSTSDVLFLLGVYPNAKFGLDAALQFNSDLSRTERASLQARYSPEPRKNLSVSYRYIREIIDGGATSQVKQLDVAGQWPVESLVGKLGRGWYAVGRVNYSVPDNKVVEAVGGFEYDGDCWIGRLVAQRLATGVGKATNSIFWQIELNGMSRIGTNPLDVLRRNIPGYQVLNTLETGRQRMALPSDVFNPLD